MEVGTQTMGLVDVKWNSGDGLGILSYKHRQKVPYQDTFICKGGWSITPGLFFFSFILFTLNYKSVLVLGLYFPFKAHRVLDSRILCLCI